MRAPLRGSADAAGADRQDFTFGMWEMLFYCIPFMIPAAVFGAGFAAMFGVDPLLDPLGKVPLLLLIAAYVALLIVHEAIHGLTWLIAGRLRARDIKFGFHLMSLTPFAHARVAMKAGAYRLGAAAPTVVLGVLPAGVALMTGDGCFALAATLMLASGAGDLLILWRIAAVPGGWLVKDHESLPGCIVYPPAAAL